MDQPPARSEHGIIRLLAFNYGYFRLHFYFRIHILSSAKSVNSQIGRAYSDAT